MARENPKTEAYRTGRENICKNDYKNAGKIVQTSGWLCAYGSIKNPGIFLKWNKAKNRKE